MWAIFVHIFFAMNIDNDKKQLRKDIRRMKKNQSENDRLSQSENVLSQVEQLIHFQNANTVMCYWSMDDEVFTHDFVRKWSKEKNIVLPIVKGDLLSWCTFTGMSNMKDGDLFGIPEPIGDDFTDLNQVDLIIVPGVAFDVENNRMGRGKAYYDKTLKSLDAYKLGICFDFQLLKHVPVDEHDVKMDQVIAPKF